jgi:hypothetical protein
MLPDTQDSAVGYGELQELLFIFFKWEKHRQALLESWRIRDERILVIYAYQRDLPRLTVNTEAHTYQGY